MCILGEAKFQSFLEEHAPDPPNVLALAALHANLARLTLSCFRWVCTEPLLMRVWWILMFLKKTYFKNIAWLHFLALGALVIIIIVIIKIIIISTEWLFIHLGDQRLYVTVQGRCDERRSPKYSTPWPSRESNPGPSS